MILLPKTRAALSAALSRLREEWAIRRAWWRMKRVAKRQKDTGRALPPGRRWIAHDGAQARTRRLRQAWSRAQRFTDPASVAVRRRMWSVVHTKREPQYTAMVLSNAALLASARTGAPYAVALGRLLDEFEAGA